MGIKSTKRDTYWLLSVVLAAVAILVLAGYFGGGVAFVAALVTEGVVVFLFLRFADFNLENMFR